jgi:hypothetical protein
MSVVGSLIFCVDCGNLLDSVTDKSKNLDCSQCGHSYPSKNFANLKVVTKSAEGAFPSVLKSKRSEVKTIIGKSDMEEGATVSFLFSHWLYFWGQPQTPWLRFAEIWVLNVSCMVELVLVLLKKSNGSRVF